MLTDATNYNKHSRAVIDDVHFDTMEVEEFRYQYGEPLTTMMRRFHQWYMKTCSESRTTTSLDKNYYLLILTSFSSSTIKRPSTKHS